MSIVVFGRRLGLVPLILLVLPALLAVFLLPRPSCARPLFDAHQRAWVAQHPVVRYADDPTWGAIDSTSGNEHVGLARDFLDRVSALTGIRFEFVLTRSWRESLQALRDKQIDLLPCVPMPFPGASSTTPLIFGRPYFSGQTLVVTAPEAKVVTTPDDLRGRTVALQSGSLYECWLRTRYPDVKLVTCSDPASTLDAVSKGQADAAIGPDHVIRPLLRHRYTGLRIAGVVADWPVKLSMATRADMRELQQILDRALSSIDAGTSDQISARWLETEDDGASSQLALFKYYRQQLLFVGLVLATAVFAAWRADRAAREGDRRKSLFLAMMSHEIRNPMHAVQSYLELLDQRLTEKRERRLLAAVRSASARLFRLLGDILDHSRLEMNELELMLAPTDPIRVARDVIALIEPEAAQKGLETSLIAPTDLPLVMVDPLRLEQILLNLLSNAVKFTAAGSVTMRVSLCEPSASDEFARLVIEVRDTGPGIPRAVRDNLFQPFVRGSPGADQPGGAGLGLWICHALVNLMGGQIRIQSCDGEGTVAWVELQLMLAREQTTDAVPEDAGALTRQVAAVRVLVIEDEPFNQHLIAAQLGALGVAADVRGTGDAGFIAFREQDFAAVLLDCRVPHASGYETARRIRDHEAAEGLPRTLIVAISADDSPEHRQHCIESGIDEVLSKPIGLAQLGRVLQRHLGVSETPRETTATALLNDAFLNSVSADLHALDRALEGEDYGQVAELAHRIKGVALVVGQAALADAARLVESLADAQQRVELRVGVANLWQILERLRQRWKELDPTATRDEG